MGSFQTLELIETFISYAESIKRCVCIVYDPQRASAGGHALKAVRLKESFIQARRAPSPPSRLPALQPRVQEWTGTGRPRPRGRLGERAARERARRERDCALAVSCRCTRPGR